MDNIQWVPIVDKRLIIEWIDRISILEENKKKQDGINREQNVRMNEMDEKIRKIEKEVAAGKTQKATKDLKVLEKADKKRDKLVAKGKKAMKGKC